MQYVHSLSVLYLIPTVIIHLISASTPVPSEKSSPKADQPKLERQGSVVTHPSEDTAPAAKSECPMDVAENFTDEEREILLKLQNLEFGLNPSLLSLST